MPTPEELKTRIEGAIPGATAMVEDLTGGGDHFRAEVVSDRFQGLTRIEQHQLVYDVFGADGRLVRRVSFPAKTRLVGFGTGTVYAARSDEDDLQYLERYRMP